MALVAESNPREIIANLRGQVEELRARNAALTAQKSTPDNRPKLTEDQVAHIRELATQPGWTQAAIAGLFGINPATVSRIVRHQYHP
ncbi:helix-turn-helix domain-containing protein [Kibdelosporangium lantanae]|uniref:Helix-turn-helix domain-containing protein n=1 Tax=Kibdelosporangium lantanae TaxID=1497396 RepID=A0ABW3M344_9PSEU